MATVSPSGLLSALSVGSTTLTAGLYGVSGTFVVDVTAPALTTITLSSAVASLPDRVSEQLSALGTYSDGSTENLTAQVSWSSADPAVASISPTGTVTATGREPVTVSAALDGITGTTTVTGLAPVIFLIVHPALSVVFVGQTEALTSQALLGDGTWYAADALAQWSVLGGGTATVSSSGVVTASKPGVSLLRAKLGPSVGLAAVVVVAPFPHR